MPLSWRHFMTQDQLRDELRDEVSTLTKEVTLLKQELRQTEVAAIRMAKAFSELAWSCLENQLVIEAFDSVSSDIYKFKDRLEENLSE